ncbi:MAG: hypothetical protein DMG40_20435 [Acidobacteria bacterium]|nr:MAG: hypothetical protein DMG40_20435 [Acidobacteriota bacterium]
MKVDTERSRIRAALVNNSRYSFEQADQKLAASKLSLFLGNETGVTPAGQAAFLTATVTAARCFGEVSVHGRLDVPLVIPVPLGVRTVADAVAVLGARRTATPVPGQKGLYWSRIGGRGSLVGASTLERVECGNWTSPRTHPNWAQ